AIADCVPHDPLGASTRCAGGAHQFGLGARYVQAARDAYDRVELAVQVGAYAAPPEPGAADRAVLVEVIAAHRIAAAPVAAGKGELQVARGGRAEDGALPVDARTVQPGDAVGSDAPGPTAIRQRGGVAPDAQRVRRGVPVGLVHVRGVVARVQDVELAHHVRHPGRGAEG